MYSTEKIIEKETSSILYVLLKDHTIIKWLCSSWVTHLGVHSLLLIINHLNGRIVVIYNAGVISLNLTATRGHWGKIFGNLSFRSVDATSLSMDITSYFSAVTNEEKLWQG